MKIIIENLPLVAIIVSTLSLLYSVINDRSIKKLSFTYNGVQYRPLFIPNENIGFIKYELSVEITSSSDEIISNGKANTILSLKVDVPLVIKNNGNCIGNLLIEGVTDKYSGVPDFRENITSKKKMKEFDVGITKKFFKVKGLVPGEEYTINLPHIINDFNSVDNEFVIHYVFIYKNEMNNIFESCYSLRFKFEPIQVTYLVDGEKVGMELTRENLEGKIIVIDRNLSTIMYSKSDSKKINKCHKWYQRRFINELSE